MSNLDSMAVAPYYSKTIGKIYIVWLQSSHRLQRRSSCQFAKEKTHKGEEWLGLKVVYLGVLYDSKSYLF